MFDAEDEKPRARRRRLAAARAGHEEEDSDDMVFTVVVDPLGSCEIFPTRKKARKYARRHRKEIKAAFDW